MREPRVQIVIQHTDPTMIGLRRLFIQPTDQDRRTSFLVLSIGPKISLYFDDECDLALTAAEIVDQLNVLQDTTIDLGTAVVPT